MAQEIIPADLRDFILRHIDSIAQIEALLLLRRNPNEKWDAAKTAKRLYIGEQQAADTLARLCSEGLLNCRDGLYRYVTEPADQEHMIARLADVYARHLIPVTNLIHSKPRRIREFADAFKLRKDR
jgi:hypothetical protein